MPAHGDLGRFWKVSKMIQTAFKVRGEIGFPDRRELAINAGAFREGTDAERSFDN